MVESTRGGHGGCCHQGRPHRVVGHGEGTGGRGRGSCRVGFGELGREKQQEGAAEEFPKPPRKKGCVPPASWGRRGHRLGGPAERVIPERQRRGWRRAERFGLFSSKKRGNFKLPLKDTIVIIGHFFKKGIFFLNKRRR